MPEDLINIAAMVLSALCIVLASLLAFAALYARTGRAPNAGVPLETPGTVFLFDGDRLLDATPSARSLLPEGGDVGALNRLLARLEPMFPGVSQTLDGLPKSGLVTLLSGPGIVPPLVLKGESLTGVTRLSLIDSDIEQRSGLADTASLAALQNEVAAQRMVLARAPVLMWREATDGAVIWANHAYLIRAAALLPLGKDLSWPLPTLFEAKTPATGRVKLQLQAGAEWFDVTRVVLGDETLVYAIAANSAVQAETSLRNFMQTLTKTFADLPTGLAIFDRSRVLQLFNPALADLTSLSPDFLISRPTLSAVLDAMRAKAMIPEPKDYRSWRKQLTKLEEEAAMGIFEETWSLPGGQTYRVIGRPHPNGALAFMFEDISSEMSRTRRYRADLELGQSVIDAVDEAVAVFSQAGQLVMSNAAYAQLWHHDPAVMLSDASIGTLSAWWRDQSAPSLLWDDAVDFVGIMGDRAPWEGEARLLDGRLLTCRFRPLTGGATLITFRARPADVGAPVLETVSGGLRLA
jgi:PAS domain-containing protein